MGQMKRCKQCGILKSIEEFRKYPYAKENSTEGHFSTCRTCENMNSTYRRLTKIVSPDEKTLDDIAKINQVYAVLESRGLHTPRIAVPTRRDTNTLETTVEEITRFYANNISHQIETVVDTIPVTKDISNIPDDLRYWLDTPFEVWREKGLDPEYLQETVYESLKAKYRPQIGVNQKTFLPLYDNTFQIELNAILRRFDDYEEESAGKQD